MDNISVTITTESIRSCNGCFARNYTSSLSLLGKEVELLFELSIGNMQICLCESCLERLRDAISTALRKDDGQ